MNGRERLLAQVEGLRYQISERSLVNFKFEISNSRCYLIR